jgi:CBS domain-containing protein
MSERTIREIIEGQQPITASPATTVSEAARLMKQHGIGGLMVTEDDKLVGVFTERDALFRVLAEGVDPKATPLSSVMTANPQTIAPERTFTVALEVMSAGGFRHLPVVEAGRLLGIVSVRDALGNELEDFVLEMLRQEQASDVLA